MTFEVKELNYDQLSNLNYVYQVALEDVETNISTNEALYSTLVDGRNLTQDNEEVKANRINHEILVERKQYILEMIEKINVEMAIKTDDPFDYGAHLTRKKLEK